MVGHSLCDRLRCYASRSAIWFVCDALHFTTDDLSVTVRGEGVKCFSQLPRNCPDQVRPFHFFIQGQDDASPQLLQLLRRFDDAPKALIPELHPGNPGVKAKFALVVQSCEHVERHSLTGAFTPQGDGGTGSIVLHVHQLFESHDLKFSKLIGSHFSPLSMNSSS